MIWPVVAYAPKAATMPSIAAQPLNFSASGDMIAIEICSKYKENIHTSWVFTHSLWLYNKSLAIRKTYLINDVICAECNLFSCSLFFAKWLFNFVELELHLEARFNSDWCIALSLVFCLRNRIFSSLGLEWLGLEDKNNSALWSEFFLQRVFLIKGR